MPFTLDSFTAENVRTLLCKAIKSDEIKAKEAEIVAALASVSVSS
jgi:hypothetical protein